MAKVMFYLVVKTVLQLVMLFYELTEYVLPHLAIIPILLMVIGQSANTHPYNMYEVSSICKKKLIFDIVMK